MTQCLTNLCLPCVPDFHVVSRQNTISEPAVENIKNKTRSLIKGLQFPSHYLALFISVYICLVTCFLIHRTSYIRLLDLITVSNLTIFIYLGIHGSSWYSNDKQTLLFGTKRRTKSGCS